MPREQKELPYKAREESTAIVEVTEPKDGAVMAPSSIGVVMKDDLVGMRLSAGMRVVSRWGVIGKFDTPQDLFIAAREYFQFADSNPIRKQEMIKGGNMAGEVGEIEIPRPYSIVGLRNWIGMGSKLWKTYKEDEMYSEFRSVIEFLEEVCLTQKFEHAVAGIYNASIVSKDLGLVDKSETKNENVNTTIVGMKIVLE